jgi:taurine dioxygenase
MIEGMVAVHDFSYAFRDFLLDRPGGREKLRAAEEKYPPVEHPVVRTHPETGRKALYVNLSFTKKIKGLSDLESAAILSMLVRHCESPMIQVRYRWRPYDLAIWDNRCTQHLAASDFYPHHRRMHRVTLRGERPFYAAG